MPSTLLLISGIYPPDSGGPAKFALEFGEWVSKSGLGVRIQSYSDNEFSLQKDPNFETSFISRSQGLLVRYLKMIYRIGRSARSADAILSVGAFLETFLASIIFRFNYVAKVPGDIVWERARTNSVTSLNIEEFQEFRLNLKYRIFRALYTQSLKRAQIVIVPSQGLLKLCLRWGVPNSKLRLIYNSVEYLRSPSASNNLFKYDMVTVCRLVSWKGVDEIIHYAAKKDKSLLVVGDGPERSALELLAKKLKSKVSFVGNVPGTSVPEFLQQSKIFVLNSYYEGLPHALVEARIAGLISVGRSGTGSAEVIHDDVDGFLIRSNRSLEETLDAAFLKLNDPAAFVSNAKEDSLRRFSKDANFSSILENLIGLTIE